MNGDPLPTPMPTELTVQHLTGRHNPDHLTGQITADLLRRLREEADRRGVRFARPTIELSLHDPASDADPFGRNNEVLIRATAAVEPIPPQPKPGDPLTAAESEQLQRISAGLGLPGMARPSDEQVVELIRRAPDRLAARVVGLWRHRADEGHRCWERNHDREIKQLQTQVRELQARRG